MKKIINGKKYNTETAKMVANWDNGYAVNNKRYMETVLYLKRTGEYFLHEKGNAGSGVARYLYDYNAFVPGEMISPITKNEAQKLAADNLDVDKFEKIFGEVQE